MATQKHSAGIRAWRQGVTVLCVMSIALLALASRPSFTDEPANHSPSQEKTTAELKLEYARLNLQLAEIELKLAEQFNRELDARIPSTVTGDQRRHILKSQQISAGALERLKSNVQIAREQLAEATVPSTGSPEKIRRRYAEEKIRLAKIKLDSINAEKLAGKPVSELEISQSELHYRMAQLKLQLLGNPEYVFEIVDSLQRQIDQLNEELMTHDQRLSAIEEILSENIHN